MAFSQSRSASPPPPMPSPQLLPTPLPSPPPLRSRHSRQRLGLDAAPQSPPIPPTLIGSPLLKKGIFAPRPRTPSSAPLNIDLWLDGDEFGARKEKTRSLPSLSSASPARHHIPGKGRHRRSESVSLSPPSNRMRARPRSRSPPPSPRRDPPPPVPPIPAFLLQATDRKDVLTPRSVNESEPCYPPGLSPDSALAPLLTGRKSNEAMTCMRFFSIHNGRSNPSQ
ncbi:hypothetical protein EWM64_g5584 [Hericium alpestre]|uniref:Uncharacterized protein n=1 Tax=Hericium alpestre TaxID=135208 RepID=A0A4Y9ZW97_9AGAM|nr:hypothetical protein EWM64_g5584 [Hericium alpestre]